MTNNTSIPGGPAVREKAAAIEIAGRMAMVSLQGRFSPEQLVFCVAPSRVHILWLTGHMALVLDRITGPVTGAGRELPDGYDARFGMGTIPVADAAAYPEFGQLTADLSRACDLAATRVLTLRDSDLARPVPAENPVSQFFPLIGDLLSGAVVHTAYHTGQVALLRRAQGLATGLGA